MGLLIRHSNEDWGEFLRVPYELASCTEAEDPHVCERSFGIDEACSAPRSHLPCVPAVHDIYVQSEESKLSDP